MKAQDLFNNGSLLTLTQVSASLDSNLGGPVQVVNHTSRLLQDACDHHLIVFGTQHTSSQKTITVPAFRQNRYGFFWGRLNTPARTQIRASNVLLVHGFYLYSTLIALAKGKNCRIFIMPHGSLEPYQNSIGRFRKRIFDVFFRTLAFSRNVSFVVGSSDEVEGVKVKFKKHSIHVLGLGVDEVPEKYIRENGIKKSVRLLSFSRIAEKKRIDLAIEAVRVLREEGVDARLTIAGAGSEQLVKELKDLVKHYKLDSVVDFIGFVDGEVKNKLFIESDVFLLPSENENFALSVAESIVRQVPVVVSNQVAMHRFVERHKTGIVLEKLEIISLVKAIKEIISNHHIYWHGCQISRYLLLWNNVIDEWKRILLTTKNTVN